MQQKDCEGLVRQHLFFTVFFYSGFRFCDMIYRHLAEDALLMSSKETKSKSVVYSQPIRQAGTTIEGIIADRGYSGRNVNFVAKGNPAG